MCENPLYALRLGAINPKTGKERIKVLPRRSGDDYFSLCERHGKDNIIPLPCGKCPSCIEARSKSWAIRCLCEATYFERSSFITLTYNDKCCPDFLVKSDFQKFLKRLRKRLFGSSKSNLTYYACGEYGPHGTHRPHWHVIVFGYWPQDAKFSCSNKDGGAYFTSKELQDLWPFGFVSLADCSYQSCAYVARYCQKKLKNPEKKEVSLMSKGIGKRYFEDNYEKLYKYDAIFGNFGRSLRHRPSRYFDKLFERFNPVVLNAEKQQD